MKKQIFSTLMALTALLKPVISYAMPVLKIGDDAPTFKLKTHEGADFDMASRKDKWTVLFFYPKADTPGCTKQACAFRDSIKKITDLGAEVFGISVDSVQSQMAFHKKYHLAFSLLADEKGAVTSQYGSKMPVINMSKRWTFIIGPDLKIKSARKDVDPAIDAQTVANDLALLQKN